MKKPRAVEYYQCPECDYACPADAWQGMPVNEDDEIDRIICPVCDEICGWPEESS